MGQEGGKRMTSEQALEMIWKRCTLFESDNMDIMDEGYASIKSDLKVLEILKNILDANTLFRVFPYETAKKFEEFLKSDKKVRKWLEKEAETGMGVSITSRYKGAPEINGGYGSFGCMRWEIAKAIDKDFGEAYEHWYKAWGEEERSPYLDAMNKADSDNLVTGDIRRFLFASDSDASVSSKVCKAILPYAEKCDHSHNIGYSAYSTPEEDWNTLIELLKGCIRHHANLYWL